jgi:D-aminopeptidase
MSNGSGDYAIAFSTHPDCRIPYHKQQSLQHSTELGNDSMTPLFQAVVEATEEAIYNSLYMADDMKGYQGRMLRALPLDESLEILDQYGARSR